MFGCLEDDYNFERCDSSGGLDEDSRSTHVMAWFVSNWEEL